MKKKLGLSIACLSLLFFAFGVTSIKNEVKQVNASQSDSYWSSWISSNQNALTNGGTSLVSALHTKVSSNVKTISYDGLWTAFKTSDEVPGSNGSRIWDMYGGFQYRAGTDQAGSYSDEGDVYNREHSVPKSWFNEAKPAYSDLVHLVPTDGKVNGMRSNYAFGEVQNATYSYSFPARSYNGVQYQQAGVSKLGSPKAINGVSISKTKVFEPDDQYKGDFARIYMYFAVRYGGTSCHATGGDGGTIFSSSLTNSNPYFTNYGLALLRKWHVQDPVSTKEINRNDAIGSLQGNRNPFVDYPHWADKIFGTDYEDTYGDGSEDDTTPRVISVTVSPNTLNLDLYNNPTSQLTATVSVTNDAEQTVTWSSDNTNAATVDQNGVVTAVGAGSATITATSTYNTAKYGTCQVTVKNSNPTIQLVTISPSTLSLDLNGTTSGTLTAIVVVTNNADRTVTWASTNGNVASVNNGVVTALSVGSTIISATSTVDTSKVGYCSVTVTNSGGDAPVPDPVVNSVTVTPSTLNLDLNGTTVSEITATIDVSNNADTTIAWYTDNSNIADVRDGVVTAKGVGTTTITAMSLFDTSKYDTCEVTVIDSSEQPGGDTEPPVVVEVTLIGIVITEPNKLEYHSGEGLDLTGFTVIAQYSDQSTKEVTTLVNITGFDPSKEGRQLLTVKYEEDGQAVYEYFAIKIVAGVAPTEEESLGCMGSIATSSVIICSLSLFGVGLILLKKYRKFEK